MKRIYHLASCQSCQKALKFLSPDHSTQLVEIKSEGISEDALDHMAKLSGSYESLFSRRAQLYKQRGLASKKLTESDYRSLIIEHYTFLKRPVVVTDAHVFAGYAKATLEAAKAALAE